MFTPAVPTVRRRLRPRLIRMSEVRRLDAAMILQCGLRWKEFSEYDEDSLVGRGVTSGEMG